MTRRRLRTLSFLLGATLSAAGVVVVAVDQAATWWGLVLAAGCVGTLLLVLGAARLAPSFLNWGIGLLVVVAVASVGFAPDRLSPVVLVEAGCLYVAAELGWLAAAPPEILAPSRLLWTALLLGGGAALGYIALFGRAVPLGGGALLTLIGVAAAVCAFFLLRGRRRRAQGAAGVTSRSGPPSP